MNLIEKSIQRTREKLFEFNRARAIATKQVKEAQQQKNALLEKIIDDVCFQTGLSFSPENLPTIGLYVSEVLKAAKRRKEEDAEATLENKWNKRLGV